MIKRALLCLAIGLVTNAIYGQELPVYSQYFFNPFLYNPAYVGSNGYTEIFLTHRQQWVGIEDAPTVYALNIQYPTRGNIALGFSVYSEEAVLLRNSAVSGTFGYRVQFAADHSLRFGLSAGLGMNSLDFTNQTNLSDPAIANALDNTLYINGRFGLLYQVKGLDLGFSLPKLFDSDPFNTEKLNDLKFSQLDNMIVTAGYMINFPASDFAVKPYFLYRNGSQIADQIEGAAILYYKDLLWAGGSYRKDLGPTLSTGFNIKNLAELGYSYEFGPETSFSNGTHELQLRFRLGKNRSKREISDVPDEPVSQPIEVEEPVAPEPTDEVEEVETQEVETQPAAVEPEPVTPLPEAPVVTEPEPVIEEPEVIPVEEPPVAEAEVVESDETASLEMASGYYVILGVYSNRSNADSYRRRVENEGPSAEVGYSSEREFYYVYLSADRDLETAKNEVERIRQINKLQFTSAWILRVK